MKNILLILLLVVGSVSSLFAQGIEDKLWNVRIEQHFQTSPFAEGSYVLFLNSRTTEFAFVSLSESNQSLGGEYSIVQSGAVLTITFFDLLLAVRASCEITFKTETSGTLAMKDAQYVLTDTGTIEFWSECNQHEQERDSHRTDLLITMTDDWKSQPATATKLVWNGDYGCFHTLAMDSFESDGEHYASGEFFLERSGNPESIVFYGEKDSYNRKLEYLCGMTGIYESLFFNRNPNNETGLFILIPSVHKNQDFDELMQSFKNLPCEDEDYNSRFNYIESVKVENEKLVIIFIPKSGLLYNVYTSANGVDWDFFTSFPGYAKETIEAPTLGQQMFLKVVVQ